MATAHIVTKNNSRTIQKTLESIKADEILVADLGSEDDTIAICESLGALVFSVDRPRHEARNLLVEKGSEGWNFFIEPWEFWLQGSVEGCQSTSCNVTIMHNKLLAKEQRFWQGREVRFKNPVYERIDGNCQSDNGIIFYSSGRDYQEAMEIILRWKQERPTAISPWYYEACTLLAQGRWESFLSVSEHYMSLDPSTSMSAIMNRYYYAMGQLLYCKKVRPALQNLSICLAERPLMAEFWCLMGDVFYHLLKDWKKAQEFYENAMILGKKRLKNDVWPMDLTKYKSYPEKMVDSCCKITGTTTIYQTTFS